MIFIPLLLKKHRLYENLSVPASAQSLRSQGVVYRPLEGDITQIEMAMVWRRDDHSPVVEAFLELARQEMFQARG